MVTGTWNDAHVPCYRIHTQGSIAPRQQAENGSGPVYRGRAGRWRVLVRRSSLVAFQRRLPPPRGGGGIDPLVLLDSCFAACAPSRFSLTFHVHNVLSEYGFTSNVVQAAKSQTET
ncbi:hypothetical protein NSU_3490 [Novosphingobium pentaromativorans US6-1]|uniref:Uncharacterized protein n=1 Tax=Novosphingobium pentaromativorans US6-1 TaxID=1088721 RepID=G6EGF7_9SPHN|nr:hypothetical protein NSU_3490 [Novosphingobium pentaromativorans US6-1]